MLLPLSIVVALAFAVLGMPQTLAGSVEATTLEGAKQTIALGPVASQEAIKQLGTNGGGFFNANAAHPFENPNAWTNMLSIWSMLLISTALTFTFGRMVGDARQGCALLVAMWSLLLIAASAVVYWSETAGNPLLAKAGVDSVGGNMEGKEVRFGQAMSALYVAVTTGLSCGAVNAMHNSLTPLGGLVPLFLIQLGEMLPGGVGSGLYGMIVIAILTVFIAGLMVGRTPEYLGKKIEAREMKLAMLALLILPLVDPRLHGRLGDAAEGAGEPRQRRTARPDRDPLCLLVGRRQQRLGVRRPQRQHALVQHDARHRDAARPLRLCRAGDGDRRVAGGQEEGAGLGRHVPDARRPVHRPAGRRDPDPRRPAILPRARARSDRRALPDARRQDLLRSMVMSKVISSSTFDTGLIRQAALDAVWKLAPAKLVRNPVMFVTGVVALLVTLVFVRDLVTGRDGLAFTGQIAAWLWFTVLFANFAEAIAEGRGKAQADALRRTRSDTTAKLLLHPDDPKDDLWEPRSASELQLGDVVLVEAGDTIPADGEVIEGIASVNESAVTGESAPVIRESGGDRSAVTGGTVVLSDWIKVRVTAAPGSSFLDRMIALVEGAERQKTPNELALSILLSGMTLIFLIAVATLWGLAGYSGTVLSVTVLVALLVTLIPTTIGGLLSAIGIAGMDRLIRFNVVATSGRAVEAAGDVDTLLLDKTGTITYGNRLATAFIPAPGVSDREVAEAALLASLADETPEGRSIVALAKGQYGLDEPSLDGLERDDHPVLGADAHLGRRHQGPQHPQGRRRCDPEGRRPADGRAGAGHSARRSTASRAPAARRWPSPRAARCSASSI